MRYISVIAIGMIVVSVFSAYSSVNVIEISAAFEQLKYSTKDVANAPQIGGRMNSHQSIYSAKTT